MKYTCLLFFFFSIIFYRNTLAQWENVPLGDSATVPIIGYLYPPCTCTATQITYKSHTNSDFTPIIQGLFTGQVYIGFLFAPQKLGVQHDTFDFSVHWFSRAGPDQDKDYIGQFTPHGNGISDSIAFVRDWNHGGIQFQWKSDSNRYFFISSPTILELINNIDDSTDFTIELITDTLAHIHSQVVVGTDSSVLPYTFKCQPKTRRQYVRLTFSSDAIGFTRDTCFIDTHLKVSWKNSSIQDSLIVYKCANFKAAPVKSVRTQSQEDFQITSFINNPFVHLRFDFNQPKTSHLQLFDAIGRQQYLPISQIQIPSGTSSQKLEVGNLSSGCYILRMKMKDQVISKSFVITR